MSEKVEVDPATQTEIEAAVYRKMIEHFRKNPEVQNIDLMNLAYFCRNCFSKWYRSAANERGIELDYDQAREIVYGMKYTGIQGQLLERSDRGAVGGVQGIKPQSY